MRRKNSVKSGALLAWLDFSCRWWIYRRSLDISNTDQNDVGTGQTVQLMAMDCEQCGNSLNILHFILDIPLRIPLRCCGFVYK